MFNIGIRRDGFMKRVYGGGTIYIVVYFKRIAHLLDYTIVKMRPPLVSRWNHHRRRRPGGVALNVIRKYQHSTHLLMCKMPFRRLVCEIMTQYAMNMRFQTSALISLQEATEAYIVGIFEDTLRCTTYAKRMTVTPKDMLLAQRLRR